MIRYYLPINKYFTNHSTQKRVQIVISNTLSGIIVISYLITMLFGFAIFGSLEQLSPMVPVVTTTVIWVGSLMLNSRYPKLAWVSSFVQLLLCAYIIYIWFFAYRF